jgi:hypothetical protein
MFHSWQDIVDSLKLHFLPSDYDEVLLDQIKGRFQGKSEPVNLFVSSMQNLFSRLTVQPALLDQLKIIRRNLLPKYVHALVLQDIKSIAELLNFCKMIDEASQTKLRYVPSSITNCLETDLIYQDNGPMSPRSSGSSNDRKQNSDHNNKVALICFNCKKEKHVFRDCTEPRKRFCYRCGQHDVTLRTCPKCNKKN